MPTLDGSSGEPEIGLLATHFGGKAPLAERFRRAQLRAQMFGDPGETLAIGRYTITGQVGAGAMGTVYRATDPSLDREVAVKVLHRSDDVHRARMTIEAKALAKLSHPNVVTVHEVGTEDEQLFVAMEFVQGKTLGAWLAEPSDLRVLDVFVQAGEGLQAAHDAGIVHRDFKPDNMIVGDDGRVRVLDFGMARTPGAPLLQEVDGEAQVMQASEPAITRTGLLAGTPGYMAPEQFEGARVDARADQFAFCIALHEAIWGVRPFDGATVGELAAEVLGGRVRLFERTPREGVEAHEIEAARAVIERGLQTSPEDRFGSMRELTDRLRALPATQSSRERSSTSRQLIRAGLALTGVCSGLFLVFMQREANVDPGVQATATAMANQVEGGVEAILSNRCGEPIQYAFGGEEGPAGPKQTLEAGRSLPVMVSHDVRVHVLRDDGTAATSGWTKDEGQEFTVGPTCTSISTGPVGSYRARSFEQLQAKQPEKRCGLGTELRNGACVPIEWNANLIQCADGQCSIDRGLLVGTDEAPFALIRQARIVPARSEHGTPLGFKLFGVRKDTALGRVGFENGDIVRSINDIKLEEELGKVTAALIEEVRTAKSLTVIYERNHQVRELVVELSG